MSSGITLFPVPLAWENSWHFVMPPLVSTAWWRLRNKRRNSILMTRHYPDLGSASDWSCHVENLPQPIRSTTQIWVVMSRRLNMEYFRPFLRRLLLGNQWWHREMWALFSGYHSLHLGPTPWLLYFLTWCLFEQKHSHTWGKAKTQFFKKLNISIQQVIYYPVNNQLRYPRTG